MISSRKNKEFMCKLNGEDEMWVFFYAPLCGTCHMARSFIQMAEEACGRPFVYDMDLNYFKTEVEVWGIESVPCLILFSKGIPLKKLYAFESVTKVYHFLTDANIQRIKGEER